MNAIQVQNAKHFHELLGNYSRWGFNHPGPFFFYLFAAGEAVFYDLFHFVPAPLNAEHLAQIAFSTACLFIAIHIFDLNVKQPLFPALAILSSVLFLYAVESAVPSSAVISVWPPYITLFCFLLLTVVSASVAAGNWRHIPLLVTAGMIMIHAHASQGLFVGVLAATAISVLVVREYRSGDLRRSVRRSRTHLIVALGIAALFLLPIALDTIIHRPNNISHIRDYLRLHAGERNSVRTSLLYLFSFFSYYANPETVLAGPAPKLSDLFTSMWFVRFYWCVFLSLSLLAVILHYRKRRTISFFLRYVFVESAVVILLFSYWSRRITGPMYNFNGYFFFSVQLLVLFALSALIAGVLGRKLLKYQQVCLACAGSALVFLVSGLQNQPLLDPYVGPIVSAVREKHVENLMLIMPSAGHMLLPGASIASLWLRSGGRFCVEQQWDFVFGSAYVCKNASEFYRLNLTESHSICNLPCSVIYRGPQLYVTGTPGRPVLNLPLLITASAMSTDLSEFNNREPDGVWSTKKSTMFFRLAPEQENLGSYKLTISGVALAGRPVAVKLNGQTIGSIDTVGRSRRVFEITDNQLVWGGTNSVSFDVPNAGPVGLDPRYLGYRFEQLLLRGDRPLKGHVFSKAAIAAVPSSDVGPLIPGLAWQDDGGWAVNGFGPEIGRPPDGVMWGSWGHADALTGKLSSSPFSTDPLDCVVVPVGHGPSASGQKVTLTTTDGQIAAEIPVGGTDPSWQLFEIYYDRRAGKLKIVAEDSGSGSGQWLAIGQPRFCQ